MRARGGVRRDEASEAHQVRRPPHAQTPRGTTRPGLTLWGTGQRAAGDAWELTAWSMAVWHSSAHGTDHAPRRRLLHLDV